MAILDTCLLTLSLFSALVYLLYGLELTWGNRQIPRLTQFDPAQGDAPTPSISMIIPARNEAETIEAALSSVLKLDYPTLEVIALNDRSEDDTGKILDRMQSEHPKLKVVHIETLPDGWLGKNHALYVGAQQAQSEWVLFTDADIHFAPDTLRRVASFLSQYPCDHLAAVPQLTVPGILLNMFVGAFGVFFSMYHKPWEVPNPKSKRFVGIGAFNLVKKSVYDAIDGHQPIRMCPDDDMKLGKRLKQAGYCQRLVHGTDLIRVAWYTSLPQAVDGLMKNAFAGVDYNLGIIVFAVVSQFVFNIWPYVALGITHDLTWWGNLATVVFITLMCLDASRYHRQPVWVVLGYPLASAVMMYVLILATARTLIHGGITWRGTFYPLSTLRQAQR